MNACLSWHEWYCRGIGKFQLGNFDQTSKKLRYRLVSKFFSLQMVIVSFGKVLSYFFQFIFWIQNAVLHDKTWLEPLTMLKISFPRKDRWQNWLQYLHSFSKNFGYLPDEISFLILVFLNFLGNWLNIIIAMISAISKEGFTLRKLFRKYWF